MMYRHGDILLIPRWPGRIQMPPPSKMTRAKSRILAEGEETGHMHTLVGELAYWERHRIPEWFRSDPPPMFVEVLAGGAELTHPEHGTIAVPAGVYEVRRQRTYTGEELRSSRWVDD
jgi:hypothetical protein